MPSNRRHDSCTKYRLQQQLPLRLVLRLLLALPLPSSLLLCVLRHFFFAFYHNLFDTRQARFAFAFVATLVASMSHRRHLCVNCTRAFPVHRLCNLCCKNNHNFFLCNPNKHSHSTRKWVMLRRILMQHSDEEGNNKQQKYKRFAVRICKRR